MVGILALLDELLQGVVADALHECIARFEIECQDGVAHGVPIVPTGLLSSSSNERGMAQ